MISDHLTKEAEIIYIPGLEIIYFDQDYQTYGVGEVIGIFQDDTSCIVLDVDHICASRQFKFCRRLSGYTIWKNFVTQSGCENVDFQWFNADGIPDKYHHVYTRLGNHKVYRYEDGGVEEDNVFTIYSDNLEFDRTSDTRNPAYPNVWYNFTSTWTLTSSGDLNRDCQYFNSPVSTVYTKISD